MSNRLAGETSPYLLQHAGNPVDWFPWGEEALSRARNEDKPILLSIGYSACHWCHVMAHESFENPEIAGLMNELFVNIKVDREERPDLDSIYMKAVQAVTGNGGWPLTVFLTPELKPFFGGTYFPPRDVSARPGFPHVLRAVSDAYRNRKGEVDKAVKQITAALDEEDKAPVSREPLVVDMLRQAYVTLQRNFDKANGGFGGAPKFPQPMLLDFLLRYSHRTRDVTASQMAGLSLEKMAAGGIYDQLGGGFHRYTVDGNWQVPHFEKMLYDNALLSQVYLHAYLAISKPLFRTIAEETLEYVLRDMVHPDGGFYCSQDADTEGVEGKYYVWTPGEIVEALGDELGRKVCDYFGVASEGNFEGKNILHLAGDAGAEMPEDVRKARGLLLEKRGRRTRPGRDEKILASWNGLMLASMAEAACVLGRREYLEASVASGSFLMSSMVVDGSLRHSFKDGRAGAAGYLEDYALVIEGLLNLHQATFSGMWMTNAIGLANTMIDKFWDEPSQALYDSSLEQRDLFVRPRSTYDGAFPSGASAAASVLLKLARLTGDDRFQRVAVQSLRSMREPMLSQPLGCGNWLCALDFYLSRPAEIAVVGARKDVAARGLTQALFSVWLPNKVVAARDPGDPYPVSLKLLENKETIDGRPTVYVCQDYTCKLPAVDAGALATLLKMG